MNDTHPERHGDTEARGQAKTASAASRDRLTVLAGDGSIR
jgi:hypothetical protein